MASTFICLHCGCTCWCNPRVKNQKYCCKKECQQSRISTWKKRQYKTNRNYKINSLSRQKQWRKHYPADQYQSSYRQSHPDYVIRNQELQRIRNKKRQKIGSTFIVKNNALLLQPGEGGVYMLSKVKKNMIVNRNALTLQPSVDGAYALFKLKRKKIVNSNALMAGVL